VIGDRLRSRTDQSRATESDTVHSLNRMLKLERLISVGIAWNEGGASAPASPIHGTTRESTS
jgi:hypothetical protein